MSDDPKHHNPNHHHTLPWLERLAVRVPGYSGYRTGLDRRAADVALREAIAHQLEQGIHALEVAGRQCIDREANTEAEALQRIISHIRKVISRVRQASSGVDQFYKSGEFRAARADALHAIDHEVLELAEEFAKLCGRTSSGKDWQPHVVKHLEEIERKLDARSSHHSLAAD